MPAFRFSTKQFLVAFAAVGVGLWLFTSFQAFGPLLAMLYGIAWLGILAARRDRPLVAAVAYLALLAVGMIGYPVVAMMGHRAPLGRLNRIQTGATRAEVESLLGQPTRSGDGYWQYSGYTCCCITVEFDPDGKVVAVLHDH